MIGSSLSFPPIPKRCRSLTTVDLNPRCISASPTTSTSRWISLRRIISKIRSRSIPQSPHLETRRSGHRRSNSADASSSSLVDAIDAKKALSPYKLAQLWTVDPKRAKRVCFGIQLYFDRVSFIFTVRDTTGLTTENTELKLRLQGMEQQANLCDDIPYDLSEMLSSESIGQFQGLDIGNGVSHNLMPDCPSICVNNINNAF
ncbi:bZIP transcription factor 18 [Glycine soja]